MKRFRATVKHEGSNVGDLPWLEEFWAVRHEDAQAEIARLTAALDAAQEELGKIIMALPTGAGMRLAGALEGVKMLRAERDTARAEAAKWQADANLMLGFAELAYEAGAAPSSSELIAARDRALAARDKATREQALREAAEICDKNDQVSGWVSRDAILALIEPEGK